MKKKVSLKDIAQKVGVSTALVSYVLNNQKEGRIGKEVTKRIREAAKELNYRTNQIARSLKTNKTLTLGLIVADISNPFWSSIARIIEDEAEKNNYTVLFSSSDESEERLQKLINVFLNHQVDGLIIAPTNNSASHLLYLQENEIPFVLVDRYFPDVKASYVAIDNYKAGYELVKHVINNGFNKVGLITFETALLHLRERKRGYMAAIQENGLFLDTGWIKEIIMGGDLKVQVEQSIDELLALPEPVEAILFATNELSRIGLKHIIKLPVKIPDDLAIISFDESDAADLFYAPITYMKQPIKEMGELAIKLLLESFGKNDKVTEVNLEADFIIQESSIRKGW